MMYLLSCDTKICDYFTHHLISRLYNFSLVFFFQYSFAFKRVVADQDSWIHMKHLVDVRHLFRELGSLFSNYVTSQVYFSEKSVSRHTSRHVSKRGTRSNSRHHSGFGSRNVSVNRDPMPVQLQQTTVRASLRKKASDSKKRLGTPTPQQVPNQHSSKPDGEVSTSFTFGLGGTHSSSLQQRLRQTKQNEEKKYGEGKKKFLNPVSSLALD